MRLPRKLQAGMLLAAMLMTAGCSLKAPHFYKPTVPPPAAVRYSLDGFLADKAAYDAKPEQVLRDKIIRQIEREIEIEYSEYEIGLAATRALGASGFDILESGGGVAGSLVAAEKAKQLLAVALLGIQGVRRSVDKNFFSSLPPEIIITAMRSAREEKRNEIDRKMALDVKAYPWEEAQLDLTQFYYRGTLQNALQTLANAANARQTATDEQKAKVLDGRTAVKP